MMHGVVDHSAVPVAMLLLILIALSFSKALGQFPRVCTTKEALISKICCPNECGKSLNRGECKAITVHSYIPTFTVKNDDRLQWPRHYFQQVCFCNANFAGFDCNDCAFGYNGTNCTNKHTVTRKEIRELNKNELEKIISYLNMAKTTTSEDYVILISGNRFDNSTYKFHDATIYDIFTWMHYYVIKPIFQNKIYRYKGNFAHKGPAFPVWHRRLLLFLEREIQKLMDDYTFALPYWDWGSDKNCTICTSTLLGDNTNQGCIMHNTFSKWKSICHGYNYRDKYCLEGNPGVLPFYRIPESQPDIQTIPNAVNETLKWKNYDTFPYNHMSKYSFRNVLEGFVNPHDGEKEDSNMHNRIHDYMAGTMAEVPISANDPMFVVHHAFVDKIFEMWIQMNSADPTNYPKKDAPEGQHYKDFMVPFFPLMENKFLLQKSTNFGYKYSRTDNDNHYTPVSEPVVYNKDYFSNKLWNGGIMTTMETMLRSLIQKILY